MRNITQAELRERLDYNPETGLFQWKGPLTGRKLREAGSTDAKGYRCITIDGVLHKSHRLAWLYVHGTWPAGQIDHLNGLKGDNRIANLRDVTNSINNQNKRRPDKDSKSPYLGVTWCKSSCAWRANIGVNNKVVRLGSFRTPEAAYEAYLNAKRELHPGCTI
jgi:hypothetical protein